MIKSESPVIIAFSLLLLTACDSKKEQIKTQTVIYSMSLESNDVSSALSAAYQIVAIDTQSTFLDSIAVLYMNVGNYTGAELVARRALNSRSTVLLKEVLGKSQKSTGKYSDAIITFQELIKDNPDESMEYEYNVGECFFFLDNPQSCLEYMKKVTENEKSGSKQIELIFDQKAQFVSYHMAAMNTVAFVLGSAGNIDQSLDIYAQLLQLKPDFELAKNNYQYVLGLKELAAKSK